MQRGTHRIFLGMAAGVGKTYRALQELRLAHDSGRDAVIAYLEPHGRAETVGQAVGLEVLPRRVVDHGGAQVPELDLPAVLDRHPEICLVDELAHTNAPGVEHHKRWEDVEALLEAGIDVLSTVNVQHLESVNDLVTEITGVPVRETVPDRVLALADEVVIIDLSPAELLDRLRAGKVYAPERVPAALNGFFKVEHLDALRELALRRVAEGVEAKRRERPSATRERELPAIGERILAVVTLDADGRAVLRRAAYSAQRLGAPLVALAVMPPRPPQSGEQMALDRLTALCRELDTELVVRQADDPVRTIADVARERQSTYVMMAVPERRWLGRFGATAVDRVLDALPEVDVRVVRDRGRSTEASRRPNGRAGPEHVSR